MAFKTNNPGCPCCDECPECFVFEDVFFTDTIGDYTQVEGTWTIASSRLKTEDDDALIIHKTPCPTGKSMSVYFGTAQSRTYADPRKCVFLYEDEDNYAYCAVTLERYDADTVEVTIKLYQRIAGSETELGNASFLATGERTNAAQCGVAAPVNVCTLFDAETDECDVTVISSGVVISATIADASGLGSQVGFATGTAGAPLIHTESRFSRLLLIRNNNECGFCGCRICETFPEQIELEIVGLRNRDCASCESTTDGVAFVLDKQTVSQMALKEFRACEWFYEEELPGCGGMFFVFRVRIGEALGYSPANDVFKYFLGITIDIKYPLFGGLYSSVNVMSHYTEQTESCRRINCTALLTGVDVPLEDSSSGWTTCYWNQQSAPLIKCRALINPVT